MSSTLNKDSLLKGTLNTLTPSLLNYHMNKLCQPQRKPLIIVLLQIPPPTVVRYKDGISTEVMNEDVIGTVVINKNKDTADSPD